MPTIGVEEVLGFIKGVEQIRDASADDKDKLQKCWPESDARTSALAKHVNVLNRIQLGLFFLHKDLLSPDWWRRIGKGGLPLSDMLVYAKEYETFIRMGFVLNLSSSVESSFRLFVRALDPSACRGGLAEFNSVYSWLLKRLGLDTQDSKSLLDLLRHVRNTQHNNGVYFDRQGKDRTVEWREQIYAFQHEKAIDFVHWPLLLNVASEIQKLLVALATHKELKEIPVIPDPYLHG